MVTSPLIFDIARGSFVDGPGIRTVIFLKGCPLNCIWCHNPESQDSFQEMTYDKDKCLRCGECSKKCPLDAIDLSADFILIKDKCIPCNICSNTCVNDALRKIGEYHSVDELHEIILRDKSYYQSSKGGVTFSGGEPLSHIDFLSQLCKKLKEADINVAIDTCGYFDFNKFKRELLPYVDIALFDIKLAETDEHRKFTGVGNKKILKNLIELKKLNILKIIVRIPLIPKITTSNENLKEIFLLLKDLKITDYEFKFYNPSGIKKSKNLGKKLIENIPDKPLTISEEHECYSIF